MRALTAAELAILKSRFMAGADGHRQQVKLTARVLAAAAATPRSPNMPWVARMPNGHAALLFRADNNAQAPADLRVFFFAYQTEHAITRPIALFPYNSLAYGLVVWNAQLLAICRDAATGNLRYRTSPDSGATWTAEAGLGALSYAAGEASWGGGASPSFQLATNKAATALYLFTKNAANNQLMYRTTANSDPTLGWSALTYSGLTIPSLGRNYGGSQAANQGFQRAFIVCETKTAGTWAAACEADDGDWHANHMCTTGTLGGVWTRRLNAGYGGGLSGGQGANGGVFLDENGDLVFYVIDDGGQDATRYRSLDSGLTWAAGVQIMPAAVAYAEGIGGGAGAAIPSYTGKSYIWGAIAGGGKAIGVHSMLTPANWLRIYGIGASTSFKTYESLTTDVSDRVIAISTQKDADLDAGSFNVELANVDGACNLHDPLSALYAFMQPNARIEISQWHGDVANKVKTFTGILSQPQQSHNGQTITLVGLDRGKKLIKQSVVLGAPQALDQTGYVRDMGNYVYLNKTVNEVLDDLITKAGLAPTLDRAWYPSSYVFKELKFQSGSLMAAAKEAAKAAGLVLWADEDGIFRTAPIIAAPGASVWTFRAREDITDLGTEVDDDTTYTRVRVIGKANLGAKYLAEQFVWPGQGSPAGIEYDKTTKTVWYLDYNRHLYRLDPAANMAVLEDTDLGAWLAWPDGIALDPLDDHLWISDGLNATLGNNVGRTYRKINRSTKATLLGPFTNPDGDHCGIHAYDSSGSGAGPVRLYLPTYTTAQLVRMNADGSENSRVASPVALPTAISSDTGGGYYLSAWDQSDFFQIAFNGSIVNRIAQPQKNANEIGSVTDPAVFDFGDVYQVFKDQNTIVKYALSGTPSSATTATLAEAVAADLEDQLQGERRYLQVVDLGITDLAMAQYTANRLLAAARQYRFRVTKGAVGNPGLQLHDRVTLDSPADGIASDWVVRSIRADQTAAAGTFLMAVVLEPHVSA